jgi:hypothetical protein
MVSKNPLKNRKGDTLKMKTVSYWHIRYSYCDGFTIIDEFNKGTILTNSEFGRKDVTILQFFQTYNNGVNNLERRPGGVRIFHNKLDSKLIKNKYDNEFWEEDSYLEMKPFDYEYLLIKVGTL